MKPTLKYSRKKVLLVISALVADMLFFMVVRSFPKGFRDFMVSCFGLEAPALAIIAGFVTVIVSLLILVALLHKKFGKFLVEFRTAMRDEDVAEIARRYFVMNAFDGALMMMGVVVGAYFAGEVESRVIISAGFGASLAMGISGASGAYLAERAEGIRDLKELKENARLGRERVRTYRNRVLRESLFLALVDSLSPILAALPSIIPFFLSLNHLISIENAVIISTVSTMVILFLLGAFLGKTARENVLIHGLVVVLVGIVTFLFCLLLPF